MKKHEILSAIYRNQDTTVIPSQDPSHMFLTVDTTNVRQHQNQTERTTPDASFEIGLTELRIRLFILSGTIVQVDWSDILHHEIPN